MIPASVRLLGRRGIALFCVIAFALAMASLAPAQAQAERQAAPQAAPDADGTSPDAQPEQAQDAGPRRSVPYKVEFSGDLEASLQELIERVSILKTDIDTPPLSDVGLRRRVRADVAHLEAALRSQGYYAARVAEKVDLAVRPVAVEIAIDTGERYLLEGIEFRLIDERPTPHAVWLLGSRPKLEPGAPARSDSVKTLVSDVLARFVDAGYLGARLGEREFRVDHATRRLTGVIELSAGTRARFGAVQFEGLVDVREDHARSLLKWTQGDYLRREQIDATNAALLATRLFDSVRVDRKAPVAGEDVAPVTIVVVERAFRSIGFGLDYDTEDGISANAFWEHRNLSGAGRRIRFSVHGGLEELGGDVAYRRPNFFHPDRAFLGDLSLGTEDTKAYEAERAAASVGIERLLAPGMVGRVGVGFDATTVEAASANDGTNGNETVTFVSVPLVVRYDSSDSLLAPSKGVRADFSTTPFFELFGSGASFSKNRLTLRGYRPTADGRWVGALRTSIGGIFGVGRSEIPIDKRFFAGGGGSVRGYEHQFAGPLDVDRIDPTRLRPLGGRSVLESGAELRRRIGESFGLVGFVDGGAVYEGATPDLSKKFFIGAGLGLRYYTAIGPVRLDVATPVNGRASDDPVQIYISIGESY